MATLLNTRHKMLMSAVILWSLDIMLLVIQRLSTQVIGLTDCLQIYQEHSAGSS